MLHNSNQSQLTEKELAELERRLLWEDTVAYLSEAQAIAEIEAGLQEVES